MKKIIYPAAALIIMIASAFTFVKTQDWKINDDYSVKFTSEDPSGIFQGLKGNINFDEKNLANSKFDVTIDVETINTGNGMKNNHAKSEKWFDAAKYPVIKFTSTVISKTASGYKALGSLEIHGVKKEITIPFSFQKNIFSGSFDINRLDYNIGEAGHGSTILKVEISVPVSKA